MEHSFKRKYGLNVSLQPKEDEFKYASSSGLHHIEINLSRDKFLIETYSTDRINKLQHLAKLYDIKLSFHIPHYINISEILPPLRKSNISYLLKCIQIASELRVAHITLHVGSFYWFPAEPWMRKKALQRFLKSLSGVLKVCEDKNVTIVLENVVPIPNGTDYYFLGDSIEDFKFIFSRIDSKYLKFCLDTGHANMGEGVLEYINNFQDKLSCIHYHDNNGFNDEHLPIGEGKVPWENLAGKLLDIKYNGPIISECHNIKPHESAILFDKYFNKNLSE